MNREKLQGKRYIGLLRCSSPGQKDTSIQDQRRLLDAFGQEHGMVCVDHVSLEGVSGSVPGNRTDIQELVARKQTKDDFDVLLVQDTSRLTRAGVHHAHRIQSELNAVGIDVVFSQHDIPDDETGELMVSVRAFSDQHQAKSISLASTRGSMSSLLEDRSAYCRRPPYGIDKLYLSSDGKPLHIIRNCTDGTQLMLDADTGAKITEFGINEKSGVPNHYLKQKQERVQLIPGDKKCVEVVRRIYRRHYIDGWGWYRIAKELNGEGMPSPTGRKWNNPTVGNILRNPIYLGRGIGNRYTSAIYHMRAPNRPVESEVQKRELYDRKRPALRTRKGSDWIEQQHPQLTDLLDPEVREIAAERQARHLSNQALGHSPKPNRDRHRDSKYILKGILHSKQGDLPMTGITTGNKGSKKRYYRISRAHSAPDDQKVLRKQIPADPLEEAVLEAVKATFLSLPDLRERIGRQIQRVAEEQTVDSTERDELLAERDDIRKKLEMVIDHFDSDMQDLGQQKIGVLRNQLRSVEQRLAHCSSAPPQGKQEIEQRINQTVDAIHRLAEHLSTAPPATLRQYLKLFIRNLVVDLETREVLMEIGLPETVDTEQFRMCLVESSAYKSFNETHRDCGTSVALYRLVWDKRLYIYATAPKINAA